MPRLLHQFLVTLILMMGIVAYQSMSGARQKRVFVDTHYSANHSYTPINNVFLPDVDFPEAFKRFKTFYGASLRLKALFASDLRVKEVAPFPMLPYGVPESAAGKGEFLDYTPFMVRWKFVKELPVGVTEGAIDQIENTGFSPATVDGKPVSQWVMINIEFGYVESRFTTGCSTIEVTVMDDSGVRWTGNTWVNRQQGCVMN